MDANGLMPTLHDALLRQWRLLDRWSKQSIRRDTEKPVHELRITTRRLGELTALASDVLEKPDPKKTKDFLGSIRRIAGEARNADALITLVQDRVKEHPEEAALWKPIEDLLQEERPVHRSHMCEGLSKLPIAKTVERWKKALAKWPHGDEPTTLRIGIHQKKHLAQRRREFNAALRIAKQPEVTIDQIHDLRIAGKRQRYALEVAACLGDQRAAERLTQLRDFQKALGHWHDLEILGNLITARCADEKFLRDRTSLALSLLSRLQTLRGEQCEAFDEALHLVK